MTQSQFFNNFFTLVAETVQLKIKFSSKSFRSFSSTENNDSFIITTPTNKKDIFKIISTLNIDKFYGPNSIPTKILHLV